MTEIGFLLYRHLKKSPSFRYALVGVEVDAFRFYHELIPRNGKADVDLNGLVISEKIYEDANKPLGFVPFKTEYFWKPYKGEVYTHFTD
ncbi:hypothetical protein [Baaleninema simplex]|uniref:hypothetical protein n=1 Tax=Baaleninema simplex TaxID=2862350 RepID=UPI00037A279A|nr:hypothetical protein [Baaleninema simplex]